MTRPSQLDDALRYVAQGFSASRAEIQARFAPTGDMLATALLTSGYCTERNGRIAVTDTGRRRLVANAGHDQADH